jgi:DNA polymerase-3 subunit epsilon
MVDINPRATQKNHITYGMVAGKELDCERVEGILDQADLIVAHNAPFDKRFVGKLFPRANAKTWLCSMNGIDWMSHGMTSKSLDHLLPQHGFHSGPKHRALSDAAATLHLLQKPALSGEPYFAELLHRSLKSRTSSYVTGPSSAIIKP